MIATSDTDHLLNGDIEEPLMIFSGGAFVLQSLDIVEAKRKFDVSALLTDSLRARRPVVRIYRVRKGAEQTTALID